MTTRQRLLLATDIYLALLAATTFFTRATKRRFLAALAGGLAVVAIGVGVEPVRREQVSDASALGRRFDGELSMGR